MDREQYTAKKFRKEAANLINLFNLRFDDVKNNKLEIERLIIAIQKCNKILEDA